MKIFLLSVIVFLSYVNTLFSYNFLTPDYARTLNRSASIDLDAVYYNPAGTTKIDDGIYFQLGNQFDITQRNFYQIEKNNIVNYEYAQPHFSFLYRRAGYSFYTLLGTAYQDGGKFFSVFLDPTNVTVYADEYKRTDSYYELVTGGAYAFNDVFSFSAGFRFVNYVSFSNTRYYDSSTSNLIYEDYQSNAYGYGFGGQVGIMITPIPWLGISVNYRSEVYSTTKKYVQYVTNGTGTPLHVSIDGLPSENYESYALQPATLDIGFLFNVKDIVIMQLTGQIVFEAQKDFIPRIPPIGGNPATDPVPVYLNQAITYSAGFGLDWRINKTWLIGTGLRYEDRIAIDYYYQDSNFVLFPRTKIFAVGIGFVANITESIAINLGISDSYLLERTVQEKTYGSGNDFSINLGINLRYPGIY